VNVRTMQHRRDVAELLTLAHTDGMPAVYVKLDEITRTRGKKVRDELAKSFGDQRTKGNIGRAGIWL